MNEIKVKTFFDNFGTKTHTISSIDKQLLYSTRMFQNLAAK